MENPSLDDNEGLMPPEKYSSPGSQLMLMNGSTALAGGSLSGKA